LESLSINTPGDFGTAAAIVIVSFVIAKYACPFLRRMIEKGRLGQLTVGSKKNLLRLPGFVRILIMAQGSLIAFNQFQFQPDLLELATTVGATITIFRDVFLFLSLAITCRAGFDAWATRVPTTAINNVGNHPHATNNPVNTRIRKARTLINLLLLPLGVVIFLPHLDLNFPKEHILYVAVLFLLVIGGVLAFIITSIQKKSSAGDTDESDQVSLDPEIFASMAEEDPDFQMIVDIVNLFLKIVKHGLGADKDTPCRINLIKHDTAIAKYLFEMEVHLYGNWKKTRITVGRLAADSGSRSKCFYAIYNEYIVIKIPPIPITEPTEYIDSLKFEAGIAQQIDMKACIIPIVSVILKYIAPSIDAQQSSSDSPEERAMAVVKHRPDLYHFLKVAKTFAYFMDMSKYYFLQNVIEMLHKVNESGKKVPFQRIKAPVEGIAANLLVLLSHIAIKGVALRDLKPDNLLVAGDRDRYPNFLINPKDYIIGLIDIETAVVYGNPHLKSIGQPGLGGSPRHATPSHFFKNDLIHQIYGEVADILHLQDWQGTISVIYKVITNNYLFENTALLVPGIVQGIHASSDPEDIRKIAIETSREFWCSAKSEFRARMAEEGAILEEVKIPVAEPVISMFMERISTESHSLTLEIKELITSQTLYPTDAHRQKLFHISPQEIEKLLQKLNNQPKPGTDLPDRQKQAINFLQDLWEMKIDLERRKQLVKLLENPTPKIPARLLLEAMFSLVTQRMHLRKWKKLPAHELDALMTSASDNPSEKPLDKTCLDYQTIMDKTVIEKTIIDDS
jgi:serine/threonine protein kinase